MVRTHYLGHDEGGGYGSHEIFRDKEVIDPPADIPHPGAGYHVPPGILARFFIIIPEDVDEAFGDKFIHPGPLHGEETGGLTIFFGMSEVDFLMGGIVITAHDQPAPCLAEGPGIVHKGLIEVHFVFQPGFAHFTVGEIDIEKDESRVFRHDDTAFEVQVSSSEAKIDPGRFFPGEGRYPAVSLPFGVVPIGVIAGRVSQGIAELGGLGLGFLQAQDIGRFPGQPVEKSVPFSCPDPVDVPG